MSWLAKLLPKIRTTERKGVPEGLWSKCPVCDAVLYTAELKRNLYVCPKCDHHMRVNARQRLEIFLDEGANTEIAGDVVATDRLKFRDTKRYKDRLVAAQKKTSETEAIVVLAGQLKGMDIVASAFEFAFIGGSMGAAVGERFVQGINHCIEHGTPMINFAASGGARMQESLFSLFQMSKTSAALGRLADAKLPFISVLTDPTMGGVSASLAMLGDIIIAEPKALIGFAGPRVIEQTVRQTLPEGFQYSEFLLEKGAVDMILDRREMRNTIAGLLAKLMHHRQPQIEVAGTQLDVEQA